MIQLLIKFVSLNLSYCKLSKIIRKEIIVEKLVPLSQGSNGSNLMYRSKNLTAYDIKRIKSITGYPHG